MHLHRWRMEQSLLAHWDQEAGRERCHREVGEVVPREEVEAERHQVAVAHIPTSSHKQKERMQVSRQT